MYDEADLLPLSALQHLAFCPRQWGLIHLEGVWSENKLTVEGNLAHKRVHEADNFLDHGVLITRGLAISSRELGLAGVADVVEFSKDGVVRPVEHKRGKPKDGDCDMVQLCAQAMCLEEMLGRTVSQGELFYHATRRRMNVRFDKALRQRVRELAGLLHDLTAKGRTPEPNKGKHCQSCSLKESCLPGVVQGKSARSWLKKQMAQNQEMEP